MLHNSLNKINPSFVLFFFLFSSLHSNLDSVQKIKQRNVAVLTTQTVPGVHILLQIYLAKLKNQKRTPKVIPTLLSTIYDLHLCSEFQSIVFQTALGRVTEETAPGRKEE